MSQKVDPFNGRKHRRYTKKTPQFGGGTLTYTVKTKTNIEKEMVDFLKENSSYNPETSAKVFRISKVTVPKDKRDSFLSTLKTKTFANKSLDRMGCLKNCDYEVTTPLESNITFTEDEYKEYNLTNILLIAYQITLQLNEETQQDALNAFKYFAKKNKLDVKDFW
jgi:hypothetical protein